MSTITTRYSVLFFFVFFSEFCTTVESNWRTVLDFIIEKKMTRMKHSRIHTAYAPQHREKNNRKLSHPRNDNSVMNRIGTRNTNCNRYYLVTNILVSPTRASCLRRAKKKQQKILHANHCTPYRKWMLRNAQSRC